MIEVWFLIAVGLIAVIFASIQDLKKREVTNWISFSLIVFALGFRFFYSLFSGESFQDLNFFYYGLIGLGIFLVIGHLFYYGRVFAGGDAKLMIALGTVLPLSNSFNENLNLFVMFLFLFLVVGGIYGILWSFVLVVKHWKNFAKEYKKQFILYKKFMNSFFVSALLVIIIGIVFDMLVLYLGVILFLLPVVYIYAKAIDESCMVKKIKSSKLVEGDWIYNDIKIRRGVVVKAKWEGVSMKDILAIKKNKKFVLVREGIPFVPVFFFTFLILVFMWFSGSVVGFF